MEHDLLVLSQPTHRIEARQLLRLNMNNQLGVIQSLKKRVPRYHLRGLVRRGQDMLDPSASNLLGQIC